MDIIQYGKPELVTYEYAEQLLQDEAQKQDSRIVLGNQYMIGDNPKSDIAGGNLRGMTTILVRTGVFKDEGNDEEHPATYVVEDFKDAIDLILKLESLTTKA